MGIQHNPYLGECDLFIKKNEKLVHKVCNEIHPRVKQKGIEYDDLFSVGLMGLLQAYERFEPGENDNEFSSYAWPTIQGKMYNFIRDNDSSFKAPRKLKEVWSKIMKKELEDESPLLISETLDEEVHVVKEALKYGRDKRIQSIQMGVYDEAGEETGTLEGQIPGTSDFSNIFVEEFLNTLPSEERIICELLMQKAPQKEIADFIGHSQMFVSKRIPRLKEKIRRYLFEEQIKQKEKLQSIKGDYSCIAGR